MIADKLTVEELKPCPFCGSQGETHEEDGSETTQCSNSDCFASAFQWYVTADEWNNRTKG